MFCRGTSIVYLLEWSFCSKHKKGSKIQSILDEN